ncbi:MAG: prolipoprotein diacylglyceryl transferase [Chloroflexi bacterium]|nr:prolipoprotein diacylglyceryl transferase [Chloroflexota bacterium]MBV9896763.1 prolipoprotein diacylglyceryl transferase [Chloroflexota bacterium]
MPDCPFCLAIRYTNQNDLLPADLKGVPTYAYPAYEALADFLLLALMWLLRDRLQKVPGATFLVGAVGYAVIRFTLTYLRQETVIVWGLQEAQVIALVTGALAIGVMVWRLLPRAFAPRSAA